MTDNKLLTVLEEVRKWNLPMATPQQFEDFVRKPHIKPHVIITWIVSIIIILFLLLMPFCLQYLVPLGKKTSSAPRKRTDLENIDHMEDTVDVTIHENIDKNRDRHSLKSAP